jgi:hypothetical protein
MINEQQEKLFKCRATTEDSLGVHKNIKGKKMRDIIDYTIVGLLVGIAFFTLIHFTHDEPEPLNEIETVIVKIMDKNKILHTREGTLQDGEVIIQLGGK